MGGKGLMAVLKDLIVHGPSRFINVAQFNELKADTGTFKFLKAEDLTANKATVVGLLDVQGELHTNKWTSTNIASIGGTFYISPTYKSSTAKLQFSGNANNRTITISNGSFGSASSSGLAMSAWVAQSKVMMTGSITYNGTSYPLGTCDGILNASMSSTGFTITGVNSAAIETLYSIIGATQVNAADIEISMRTIAGTKPVGILLTSYGTSQATYIDIHGGVNSNSGTPSIPNANPNVRVGYLNGLPSFTIAGVTTATPSGWGIYTDNGFFKGKIAADGGVIGGFTISELQLYTGSHSTYNANNAGLFLGKESSSSNNYYVAGGSGARWWLKSDGSAKIGAMELSADGTLTVPAANITGTLSADRIASSSIEAGKLNVSTLSAITANMGTLTTGTISYGTTGNNDSFYLSANSSKTATIAGASRSNLRLTVGSGFGVNYNGILYASGATISGDVTVSKLTVSSGATLVDNDGLINNDVVRVEATEDLQAVYDSLNSNLDELQENFGAITEDLRGLNDYTEIEVERITRNVNEYLGTNGYMKIEDQGLKITKDDFAVIITGTEILFQENGTTVAWISGQKLHINRTEVNQSMKVGNFEWMIRTDGRLTLAYTGGSN